MRIEQLEYLIDISKTHSLNMSAERLFVTQPTISEAIHKLEEELHETLLIRSKKGVSLTETGEIVLLYAKKILENIGTMHQALYEFNNQPNDTIFGNCVIGTSNMISNILAPDLIENFSKKYPSIQLNNFRIRPSEYRAFLEQDIIDVALFHYHKFEATSISFPAIENIRLKKLFEEPLIILAKKDSPICKYKTIDIKSAIEYPIVALLNHDKAEDNFINSLSHFGDIQLILKTDNIAIIKNAILSGKGICFATKSAYKRFFAAPEDSAQIKIIHLNQAVTVEYYLAAKYDTELSQLVWQYTENFFSNFINLK